MLKLNYACLNRCARLAASVLVVIACLTGCSKKPERYSDYGTCGIQALTESLNQVSGELIYTNEIDGLPLGADPVLYYYIIRPDPPGLPLVVCNFPADLALEKDQPRRVVFSGKAEVLSELVDAFSRRLELWEIEFEK